MVGPGSFLGPVGVFNFAVAPVVSGQPISSSV